MYTGPLTSGQDRELLTKAGDTMNYGNYEAVGESSSQVTFLIQQGMCERLRRYTGSKACTVVVVLIVLVVVVASVGAAVVNRSIDGE